MKTKSEQPQPPEYSLDLRRQKRKNPTPAEKLLWLHLRNNQLDGLKFRRQHPFDRYVVDFYCHAKRLIVEVDGPIHERQIEDDQMRQSELEAAGYYFLRFTNDEVLYSIGKVIARISEIARMIPLSSSEQKSPSPRGRGPG